MGESMIAIKFNQKDMQCKEGMYLDQLLRQQGYTEDHFAVAINQNFIAKPQYSSMQIHAHDHIEIITAMQGG
jgi:thiamine biosynthesis protein ThiS